MQAHTLLELTAYLTRDSSSSDLQIVPIDLLSPSHLMLDAITHVESGVNPCDGYPDWIAFTGRITQNVTKATYICIFLFSNE
jgi:hypothetical protein